MVFVCLLPAGLPQKRQTAGTKFTHRPKNQVFRPAGVTGCTDSCQTWHGRRTSGLASLSKIAPQSAQGVGMWPKNMKKKFYFS